MSLLTIPIQFHRHSNLDSESQFRNNALKGIAYYSYAARIFAYLIGLAVVITVLGVSDDGYHKIPIAMPFLFIVCLAWPHIAYQWAKRSNVTTKVVTSSLLFDAFFTGLWVPLMSFELIPSTVFITAVMMNNISTGGLKLFLHGFIAMILAIILSSLLINPSFQFESNILVILVCIPMITIYPMVLATINYKLTRLLIFQKGKLLQLSRNDSLTGVFSRRYWEQRLLGEFNRCKRSGEKTCVMMVDIDNFKNINDTYGHLVGDNVLRQLGSILQGLRNSDIAGRYGGEEFAILLPNSDLEESLLVAERLRQKIEHTKFEKVDRCTISIGIAPLSAQFSNAYKWLDQADKALYQAKANGRNRVCSELSQIED